MSTTRTRKRKPVSAARIELTLWFATIDSYYRYSSVPLGRKSRSVSDREWAQPLIYPDGHVEAGYRFTHTCRNDGAQRGDSEKFFRAVCNASGTRPSDASLMDVKLLSRENLTVETAPAPMPASTGPVVNQWGRVEGSDLGMLIYGSRS